jgi:hypothetical protein
MDMATNRYPIEFRHLQGEPTDTGDGYGGSEEWEPPEPNTLTRDELRQRIEQAQNNRHREVSPLALFFLWQLSFIRAC